jgi:hypothetical protein
MPCATISVQRAVPRRRGTGLRGCCRAPQAAAWLLAASTSYEHKGGIAKACGSRTKAFQPTAHKDAPRLKASVREVAMRCRQFVAVALILGAMMGLFATVAEGDGLQGPQEKNEDSPKNLTLDFKNARLELLAIFFDRVTGMHHIVEGDGTIELDLIVDKPVSPQEAHMMFLSALAQLGCKVRMDGNDVYITKP